MSFYRNSVFIASLTALSAFTSAYTVQADDKVRHATASSLIFMQDVFTSRYAPAAWKANYLNWDLNENIKAALTETTVAPTVDLTKARDILKKFIQSTKDYHVSISFHSTEAATLPFTIQTAEGKFFLSYVDRKKLPLDVFPFSTGDEAVTFGGVPCEEALEKILQEIGSNVPQTDRQLGSLYLTNRRGARGMSVPHGRITIGFRSHKAPSQVQNIEVAWDYTPEKVRPGIYASQKPSGLMERGGGIEAKTNISSSDLNNPTMSADLSADFARADNPFSLGTKKSYIPELGTKVWSTSDTDLFHAYIYKNSQGKMIGYIRIPSYSPDDADKSVQAFGNIIEMFEGMTSGLVIDQINNPGGSVFYLYALASMLSDQPLNTPQHEMSILPEDIMEAQTNLEILKKVTDHESAKKALGETLSGYPVSYEVARLTQDYYQFLIDESEAGRTLSRPFYIAGVDKINPAKKRYSKPILLVTNHLDFSGGDFFPAIMKDNGRAIIFGSRTAGAGGYVLDVSYPNPLGVASFRVTGSIATRTLSQSRADAGTGSGRPIENLGVQPHILYELTAKDLHSNFAEYKAAIEKAADDLVK